MSGFVSALINSLFWLRLPLLQTKVSGAEGPAKVHQGFGSLPWAALANSDRPGWFNVAFFLWHFQHSGCYMLHFFCGIFSILVATCCIFSVAFSAFWLLHVTFFLWHLWFISGFCLEPCGRSGGHQVSGSQLCRNPVLLR